MDNWLNTFGAALPEYWNHIVISVLLFFTILAWCIPSWRANGLSSLFGMAVSFAGLFGGIWLAAHPPSWAAGFIQQIQIEAPQTAWIDLRPHILKMFLSALGAGLAYVFGMALAKAVMGFWLRRSASTIPERDRNSLTVYH